MNQLEYVLYLQRAVTSLEATIYGVMMGPPNLCTPQTVITFETMLHETQKELAEATAIEGPKNWPLLSSRFHKRILKIAQSLPATTPPKPR